jgi:hypothetical protein
MSRVIGSLKMACLTLFIIIPIVPIAPIVESINQATKNGDAEALNFLKTK